MRLTKRFSLLAAAAALTASTAAFAAPTFINILTGGTSGVYYPIGVGLSQLYSTGIDGAKTSVQATKASVENLNLLQSGRGELALALGDSVADAWNGVEDAGFKAPLKKLRAIAGTYPNYIQIVANKESGITSLADLKGKRISVGAPKSGTELNARAIFAAAGLSYEDMGTDQEPSAGCHPAVLGSGHGGDPRSGRHPADQLRRHPGRGHRQYRQPRLPGRGHSGRHLRRSGCRHRDSGDPEHPGQP
jgi:TRAP transporter TAXI family solute receptor